MTASRHLKAAPSRAYPENYSYTDTGCDISASCLSCPLERCKFEMTVYEQVDASKEAKYQQIVSEAKAHPGLPPAELAQRLGISERTLYRAVSDRRKVTR